MGRSRRRGEPPFRFEHSVIQGSSLTFENESVRAKVAFFIFQQISSELPCLFSVGMGEPPKSYSSMFIKSFQIALIGFFICAANAWAGPASIQGIVKDVYGKAIKNVDVRVESRDGK